MKALVIGGSRNIGYFAAVRLLVSGATVTFLLRSPSIFDQDEVIQKYVESGKARLLKGDALVQDDVKRAWNEAAAGDEEPVDVLLLTVGSTALKFKLTEGFVMDTPNLVTQSFLNAICSMPSPHTKVITVSTTGITRASHAALPLPLKPLYSYLLAPPHKDKRGVERVAAHCTGREWQKGDGEPGESIMGPGEWRKKDGLPESGRMKDMVVVRAALLTDGECRAEKEPKGKKDPYRFSDGELRGAYTISRKDVAHFIVEVLLQNWDEYKAKCITIAY